MKSFKVTTLSGSKRDVGESPGKHRRGKGKTWRSKAGGRRSQDQEEALSLEGGGCRGAAHRACCHDDGVSGPKGTPLPLEFCVH